MNTYTDRYFLGHCSVQTFKELIFKLQIVRAGAGSVMLFVNKINIQKILLFIEKIEQLKNILHL